MSELSHTVDPSVRAILVASPRGFCAGVSYAIEIVDLMLERYGPPIYVRHEIVHNRHVVERLRHNGAIFVDDLAEVPTGCWVIFSAHGVAPSVREEAKQRGLRIVDATCPLVTKVHLQALKYVREACEILLVGHRGHVEVEGTMGHAPERTHLIETVDDVASVTVRDPDRLAVITQTTLSVDDTREIVAALRRRFPTVRVPSKDDICYATQNRQTAVKQLARQSEFVLVIGSRTSSNASRLVEVARSEGAAAELIDQADDIQPQWLDAVTTVGLTAGASTPEAVVEETIDHLRALGFAELREVVTADEDVTFPLPRALRSQPTRRSRPSA